MATNGATYLASQTAYPYKLPARNRESVVGVSNLRGSYIPTAKPPVKGRLNETRA